MSTFLIRTIISYGLTNGGSFMSSNSSEGRSLLSLLDSELSMPNIPTKTMGGEVFWNNIVECNGWRLQQNMITHHARILDDDDVRRAWGTINGMMKAMDRLVEGMRNSEKADDDGSNKRLEAMQELKQLKELLDIGAITEDEFNDKKKSLMNRI